MKFILVVDSDPELLKAFCEMFWEMGHEAYGARNSAEGLRILETTRVDLVILEDWIPVRGGVEFMREFRKRDYRLPVLLMSISGLPRAIGDSYRALGVVGFLEKFLFEVDALLAAMERALGPGSIKP